MARTTKTQATPAVPKPGAASEADARAARDATASTGSATDPAPAPAIDPAPATGIEDAVVVSEATPPSASGPKDVVKGNAGVTAAPAPVGDDAAKSVASVEGEPTTSSDGPKDKTKDATGPASDMKAAEAQGGAKARTTIGTGKDGAEQDRRMGKGGTDGGPPDRKAETAPAAGRTPVPVAPPVVERRGPGFVPLLLGGLVAGAIGYAVPTYLLPQQGPGVDVARVASLEADLAALIDRQAAETDELTTLRETQTATADSLDGLAGRLATLEAAPSASSAARAQAGPSAAASTAAVEGDAPASTAALAAVGSRVDDVAARIAGAEDGIADLASRTDGLRDDVAGLTESVAATTDRIDAAAGDASDLDGRFEALTGDVMTLRDDFGARIASVETGLATATERATSVEDNAEALAREAARNQIRAALQSGASYQEPLGVLGETPPAPLAEQAGTGVATQAALIADFPALSREALRQARLDAPETGVGSLFRNAFGARSLEPREGDDPDAILSRAEAAVRSGDLTTALGQIDALPAAAQDVLADWMARARARMGALAAAEDFLQDE